MSRFVVCLPSKLPKSFFVVEARLQRKSRAIMAKRVKKVVRRPYTKADVKELRAHSKARTPVARVARQMKRTEASLRQKAQTLKISLGHRR
jgi:hypothetical protein